MPTVDDGGSGVRTRVTRRGSVLVTSPPSVFGSTFAMPAAECAQPVVSNASRISMISLSDFFTVPPVNRLVRGQRPRASTRRDALLRTDTNGPLSAAREISCPQQGRCRVRLQGDWQVRCHLSGPRVPSEWAAIFQSRVIPILAIGEWTSLPGRCDAVIEFERRDLDLLDRIDWSSCS